MLLTSHAFVPLATHSTAKPVPRDPANTHAAGLTEMRSQLSRETQCDWNTPAAAAALAVSACGLLQSRRAKRGLGLFKSGAKQRDPVACARRIFRRKPEDLLINSGDKASEEELRDVAGCTLGSQAMTFNIWPPALRAENEQDEMALKRARLEGRRGGTAGSLEVPLFMEWPFYEAAIEDLSPMGKDDPALVPYKILELRYEMKKAFALLNSWANTNRGRTLGFTQTGLNKLSSVKVAVPILMRLVQGTQFFANWVQEGSGTDFEEFLEGSGADDITKRELRTFLKGSDSEVDSELKHLKMDCIASSTNGSALALWAMESGGVARVEFCIGHDCMETGPEAEQALMQLIAGKAAEMGATKLISRVRFVEAGKFFRPEFMENLGLNTTDKEAWASSFKEDRGEDEIVRGKVMDKESALTEEAAQILIAAANTPEAVDGLRMWLMVLGLEQHLEAANEWCEEMGASHMEEVVDAREDLVEWLGDKLCEEEKKALLERLY